MNINKFPVANRVVVKNKQNNRTYIACFKNGKLGIFIYTTNGKRTEIIFEPSTFEEKFTVTKMASKPRKTKAYLYHDKTVIYNGELKCIIHNRSDNTFYVNWYREEKGKPMTYNSFSKNDRFQSINDYFIQVYQSLK